MGYEYGLIGSHDST